MTGNFGGGKEISEVVGSHCCFSPERMRQLGLCSSIDLIIWMIGRLYRSATLFCSGECGAVSANAVGSNELHEFFVVLSIVALQLGYLLTLLPLNEFNPFLDGSVNSSLAFEMN